MTCSLHQPGPFHRISLQSDYNLLSNAAYRHANKQTNKPALAKKPPQPKRSLSKVLGVSSHENKVNQSKHIHQQRGKTFVPAYWRMRLNSNNLEGAWWHKIINTKISITTGNNTFKDIIIIYEAAFIMCIISRCLFHLMALLKLTFVLVLCSNVSICSLRGTCAKKRNYTVAGNRFASDAPDLDVGDNQALCVPKATANKHRTFKYSKAALAQEKVKKNQKSFTNN